MGKPERLVLIAGGAVLAVVLVAVFVVVALGDPVQATYEPDSPEGTVQRYLEAVLTGDEEAGRSLLSERARAQLDEDDDWWRYQSSSLDTKRLVTLQQTAVTGNRATVDLRIENTDSGGLFRNRYSWTLTVPLVRENGVWLIDDPYVALY